MARKFGEALGDFLREHYNDPEKISQWSFENFLTNYKTYVNLVDKGELPLEAAAAAERVVKEYAQSQGYYLRFNSGRYKLTKSGEGRGGRRPGAGRPKGTGKYGCRTKTIRVPEDMVREIDLFIRERTKDPAVTSLLEQAHELSKYAASIRWDGKRNTKDWLTGLHELIEKFQNDYEEYTNK